MARTKASEPQRSRSKQHAVEELNRGITTLRELSTQIDDLSRDGFPYRDAVRARTELSFRETIRRLFGEKSPEYQAHKNHKLRIGNRTESAQSTTLLKELIVALENQKAELLGLTPAETAPPPPAALDRPTLTAVPPSQPTVPVAPPQAPSTAPPATVSMTNAPATVSVATTSVSHPAQPIAPIVTTTPLSTTSASPPVTPGTASQPIRDTSIQRLPPLHSVTSEAPGIPAEKTAPASLPASPSLPTEPVVAAPSTNSATPSEQTVRGEAAPTPLPTMAPARATIPSGTIPPIPRMNPAPAPVPAAPIEPPPTLQQDSKPTDIPAQKPAPAPVAVIPARQATTEITVEKQARDPRPPAPQVRTEVSLPPAMPALASVPESKPEPPLISPVKPPDTPTVLTTPRATNMNHPQSEGATLDTLRRMCARFHLVARQLRLRKEYRPTLEITDEYDLQDLFYALLRLQFDEVGTEEWTPPYANGARRTSYLLDWEKTVVVVKQTRSGLTSRDIAEQIATDKAHYSGRPNGATLLCFIYDPDGRVGNPRGLEADLSTVGDTYRVEVIVAPK
ncbi:MAG: hypothetical protein AABZ34_05710 [Nitrospirota bacterium]